MITHIHLKNAASFSNEEGENIHDLSQINFFYGVNGSGKTTISKLIDNENCFTDCWLQWKHDNPNKTFVYSRDFVNQNFGLSSELEGVFTLGENEANVENEINSQKSKIQLYQQKIQKAKESIGIKTQEIKALDDEAKERSWSKKDDLEKADSAFIKVFQGFRSKKEEFFNHLYKNHIGVYDHKSPPINEEKLIKEVQTVFSEDISKEQDLPLINFSSFQILEESEILSSIIVGRQDVNISHLIQHLNNSDWIKNGVQYLEEMANETCPFCQQNIVSIRLKEQIDNYFDTSYSDAITSLKRYESEYKNSYEAIRNTINYSIAKNNRFADNASLSNKLETLDAIYEKNIQQIELKESHPSQIYTLESLKPIVDELNQILVHVNEQTKEHNNKIENLEEEKKSIKKLVWTYMAQCMIPELQIIDKKKSPLVKAKIGISKSIRIKHNHQIKAQQELQNLEKKVNSVQPTANKINNMLSNFGFTSFQLAQSPQNEGAYIIIRKDGRDAKNTLSEGEKTFLSFLYFIYKIQSDVDSKVVVFDDPISSLDSSILSVVSTLVRSIIDCTNKEDFGIRQVFVLTHNVYFHKEAAFRYNDKNRISYYLLKKNSGCTYIKQHEKSPVRSSYELLWEEVQEGNIVTVRNAMRRILEYYFQHLGNIHIRDLYKEFTGQEQFICKSLVSWIHDGSHNISEDLFVQEESGQLDIYNKVFKEIFIKHHQVPHYNMMMKLENLQSNQTDVSFTPKL